MKKIFVGIFGCYVYVIKEYLEILFGVGYELIILKELS